MFALADGVALERNVVLLVWYSYEYSRIVANNKKKRHPDLGNTRAAQWRENDCVQDRHGRRGWNRGGRTRGRAARGQGWRTAGGRHGRRLTAEEHLRIGALEEV